MDRGRLLTDLSCLRSSSFYWMVKKRSKHKKWQVLAQKTKLAPKVHFFLHVYYENRHINMYNICIRYILVMLVLSTCNNRFMKQKHHTLQKEEKGGIIQYYIFFLFLCLPSPKYYLNYSDQTLLVIRVCLATWYFVNWITA